MSCNQAVEIFVSQNGNSFNRIVKSRERAQHFFASNMFIRIHCKALNIRLLSQRLRIHALRARVLLYNLIYLAILIYLIMHLYHISTQIGFRVHGSLDAVTHPCIHARPVPKLSIPHSDEIEILWIFVL
jgi:hypothetical protein